MKYEHMRLALVVSAAFALLMGHAGAAIAEVDDGGPWRLGKEANLPSWLTIGLNHRTRFEHLANQFRVVAGDDATAVSMRTLLSAKLSTESVIAELELQDSRAFASADTPLKTSHINALSILQAYVGLRRPNLFVAGDQGELKIGRMTVDVGTRRLVARNGYRNTINGFAGADARWTSPARHVARVFTLVPVTRLPSDPDAIRSNDIELDEENFDTLFWGALYRSPALLAGTQFELLVMGLHERDGDIASRNRQLLSPGARAFRKPSAGEPDYSIEIVVQLGSSRASKADEDTEDLDHRALFVHAETGYSIEAPWAPRIALQYDYASGDGEPDDETNGRFDTLFGPGRPDFGPTGLYSAFARSNLNSPALRVQAKPAASVTSFLCYRLFWLASDTDAWTTTGLRDSTGSSGSFLGQQLEARVRWNVFPKNVRVEMGGAYLARGGFAKDVEDGSDDPALFFYSQVSGSI